MSEVIVAKTSCQLRGQGDDEVKIPNDIDSNQAGQSKSIDLVNCSAGTRRTLETSWVVVQFNQTWLQKQPSLVVRYVNFSPRDIGQ